MNDRTWTLARRFVGGIFLACFAMAAARAQDGDSFRSEIVAPISLQALGDETSQYSAGIGYNRYFGAQVHDEHHPTLFGEAIGNPTSTLNLSFTYQPSGDITVSNTGYGARVRFVQLVGDMGIGGSARYGRIRPAESDRTVDDYELGPELAFWPAERLHITDALLFRKIGAYRNARLEFNASEEEYVQIRHHLAYAVAEDWKFTYSHDIDFLVGVHQNFHTNNFRMNNYFMFSPTTRFSYGGAAGFRLEYRLGSRTSVLTIPLRGRVEYFPSNLLAFYAEAGYNIPTMLGQREGRMNLLASAAYRF